MLEYMLVIGKSSHTAAYVSGSTVRHVLHGVSCHVPLSATAIVYFEEYSDTEQSLTYPSEKMVETIGTVVTLRSL